MAERGVGFEPMPVAREKQSILFARERLLFLRGKDLFDEIELGLGDGGIVHGVEGIQSLPLPLQFSQQALVGACGQPIEIEIDRVQGEG